MESKQSNDGDEIIDELNEYPLLLRYIIDSGLATENDLKFNGDVELAKQYEENEAASALVDLYNAQDHNIDWHSETDVLRIKTVENSTKSSQENTFLLPRYSPQNPHFQLTTFQQPHEPRIKYLLRSLKLWQEFVNSGDLDKLQVLFNDILSEDCLLLSNSAIPPIVGRQKIYEQNISLNRNIPDYCVFYNNIVRPKRRAITLKGNSFGTLPYANANDASTLTWNIFEYVPTNKLDEHHKIQKQKYDGLKSQNIPIKIEQRASWFLLLSRDIRHITKIMAITAKTDVIQV